MLSEMGGLVRGRWDMRGVRGFWLEHLEEHQSHSLKLGTGEADQGREDGFLWRHVEPEAPRLLNS